MQVITKKVIVGDALLDVYSSHFLAMKLNRSKGTLVNWEFKKIVPKPILRTVDKRRWYLKEEVDIWIRVAENAQITNGRRFDVEKFTGILFGEIEILRRKIEHDLGVVLERD